MKIALLYTEQSKSQKDLGRMISHLSGVLKEIEGVDVEEKLLTVGNSTPILKYDHLVFCGYDHTTLGNLWLAMASTDPDKVRITMYDEPGSALDRELSAIMFRGIDSRRMPGSSATRLIYSWSHRDLVAITRQDVLKCNGGIGSNQSTTQSVKAKPRPGDSSRGARTRKVDVEGEAQTRERDEASGGTETT